MSVFDDHPRRWFRALVAFWLISFAFPPSSSAQDQGVGPSPLTAAEVAALSLAIDYLDQGVISWSDRFSSDSRWSELEAPSIREELAVRAGPREGAIWKLQTPGLGYSENVAIFTIQFPSGIDETLVLDLVEEDGWKIRDLVSLVDEPLKREDTFLDSVAPSLPPLSLPPWAPLLMIALSLWLALRVRSARTWALAATVGIALLSCKGPEVAAGPEFLRLGPLKDLRWSVTGASDTAPEALLESIPSDEVSKRVAGLWTAQLAQARSSLSEARRVLSEYSDGESAQALASLLEARLGFLQSEKESISKLYEKALSNGPDHDGIRMEMARAYALFGLDREAVRNFHRLRIMGSRMADAYYVLSRLALLEDDLETAQGHFETGWELEPMTRAQIFADPFLSSLAGTPNGFRYLELSETKPQDRAEIEIAAQPLVLPSGAVARVSAVSLEIALDEARLLVPLGASLAPEGAIRETGDERKVRYRAEALEDLETLTQLAGKKAALTQPRLRQETESAAEALFELERYEELAALTEGLAENVDHATPNLVHLRAAALTELDRGTEAVILLVDLARSSLENQRRDPTALFQLASILEDRGEYDMAIRLAKQANAHSLVSMGSSRVDQLRMEQALSDRANTHETRHFVFRFPPQTDPRYPKMLGRILEQERDRISRWIPVSEKDSKIEVELYPLFEFLSAFSGGVGVVGLYDGTVQVPFADVESLNPRVISIISHEVAHALIDRATGDRAPKWLHEGLAQHVEMEQSVINPVPDLAEADLVLAFPAIEEILAGFTGQQLVEAAYLQAVWVMHFVEREYGIDGIHRLLQATKDGHRGETILQKALGLDVGSFQTAFVGWAIEDAPRVWPTKVRRYDKELAKQSLAVLARSQPKEVKKVLPIEARMAQWHEHYADLSAPAKRSLGPVIGALRSNEIDGLQVSCRELAKDLGPLLQDRNALNPPDADTKRHLVRAYSDLKRSSHSCMRNQFVLARDQLTAAEKSLGEAARYLARFGLAP